MEFVLCVKTARRGCFKNSQYSNFGEEQLVFLNCSSHSLQKDSRVLKWEESSHSGEGVDKLHVTTCQISAMETFLREANATE